MTTHQTGRSRSNRERPAVPSISSPTPKGSPPVNADPQLPAHWSQAVTDAFWTAVNAPTYDESTAATLALAQLLDCDPEPRTFSDGGVNDIRQLYAVQDAITAAGGELTRPVHRAIDALREVWDQELRREQEKQPAAGGVVPAAPDQADLRQRIADGQGEPAELRGLPREVRHLVHAVDRMRGDWAESSEERRAELWRALHEASDAVWNRTLAVLPPPADRAAVLREAADALGRMDYDTDSNDYGYDTYRDAWNGGVMDGADLLRRLAAEAQQQTEAHDPEHTWAAELYDPIADEWVPGTRYLVRERAVNALNHAKRLGPTWKDGTPTQRRLVRATTTYTVEEPAAPAEQPAAADGGEGRSAD